jgi:hypothetical protein
MSYINNVADGRIVPQLQQLAAAVGTAPSGDARYKAYVSLLLGFLNFVTQVTREGIWGCYFDCACQE